MCTDMGCIGIVDIGWICFLQGCKDLEQVETLNLLIVKMVVKKEEESVDLNLCSCEEKPSLKKKRRSKKN